MAEPEGRGCGFDEGDSWFVEPGVFGEPAVAVASFDADLGAAADVLGAGGGYAFEACDGVAEEDH